MAGSTVAANALYRRIKIAENEKFLKTVRDSGIAFDNECQQLLASEGKDNSFQQIDYLLKKLVDEKEAEASFDTFGVGTHISFKNGYSVDLKIGAHGIEIFKVNKKGASNDVEMIDYFISETKKLTTGASLIAGVCAMVAAIYAHTNADRREALSPAKKAACYIVLALCAVALAVAIMFGDVLF